MVMSQDSTGPRVVVTGAGFGLEVHVPALRAAGFEVVGLVGADPAKTARRAADAGIAGGYTDLDEAIRKTGATAVTVATPPNTHAPLALTALARGCHVMCEKPFALDAAEAKAMAEAARKAGTVCLLGNEFRYLPERIVGARAIAEGLIGEPRVLTFAQFHYFVGNPAVQLPGWWLDKKAGGGWLGTWGSHVVDWIRTWAGEFAAVSATLPSVVAPKDAAEDSYLVRFTLANGAEGVLSQVSGSFGPFTTMVRVAGTRGTLWFEADGSAWIADAAGERALPVPEALKLPAVMVAGEGYRQSAYEIPPSIRFFETWRALIEGRTPASSVAPANFEDGVAAMQVLDAIRASAASGGELVRVR
jgi:predicted dehydrogenase